MSEYEKSENEKGEMKYATYESLFLGDVML